MSHRNVSRPDAEVSRQATAEEGAAAAGGVEDGTTISDGDASNRSSQGTELASASAVVASVDGRSATGTGDPRGGGAGGGAGAVPRDWRPVQRALAAHIDSSPDFTAAVDAGAEAIDGLDAVNAFTSDSDTTTRVTSGAEEGVAGALWFCLSVALQRSQKGKAKRRPYKRQRKKSQAVEAAATSGAATESQVDAAESFARIVDEYCARVGELSEAVPPGKESGRFTSSHMHMVTMGEATPKLKSRKLNCTTVAAAAVGCTPSNSRTRNAISATIPSIRGTHNRFCVWFFLIFRAFCSNLRVRRVPYRQARPAP